jgi:formate hydrogenlyase transcriptional activator
MTFRNVIERACVLATGASVEITDAFEAPAATEGSTTNAAVLTMEEMERRHILRALERTRGQIAGTGGAAALLAMHPNTLRSRMEPLGVKR